MLRCLPRPFLEGMQDIHGLWKGRDVEDTVFQVRVNAHPQHPGRSLRIGFESSGSRPCCDAPDLNPASRRASAGKALRSANALPSHATALSNSINYTSSYMAGQLRTAGEGTLGLW